MDQMLLKCENLESVLALLVTHRGVFFVHNLVTAIQVMASLDEARDALAVNRLLRDPRYDVLLRDLLRFVPKLDFLAMTNVVCTNRVEWRVSTYYALFSRMLHPLMQQPGPEVGTLLRCMEAYCWAGYYEQNHFFRRFAQVLAESLDALDAPQLVQGAPCSARHLSSWPYRRVLDGVQGLAACSAPLYRAWLLRKPSDQLEPVHVAELLESSAFFGVPSDLMQVALEYLAEHVDAIPERACIQVVFAMCTTGQVAHHSRLLRFIFRKIVRVFQIWISQLLQFPWLDVRLKRRTLDSALRAWLLQRGGYGVPHPEEVREVSEELAEMGVKHQCFVHLKETPYQLDVVLHTAHKAAFLVSSETARNSLTPVGGVLLQLK
eukprot:g20331.t1